MAGCSNGESKFFKQAGRLNYFYLTDDGPGIATRLADGRVVLFGGTDTDPTEPAAIRSGMPNRKKAEIYNPQDETSQQIDDTPYELGGKKRSGTLLSSGKVLITCSDIGSFSPDADDPTVCECGRFKSKQEVRDCEHATAILFDPASRTYKRLFHLRPIRALATVTALDDGRVIIIGGSPGLKELAMLQMEDWKSYFGKNPTTEEMDRYDRFISKSLGTIQIYDPERDTASEAGKLPYKGYLKGHATISIEKGKYLTVGGYEENFGRPNYLRDVSIFLEGSKEYKKIAELNFPREGHSVVRLDSKRFLVVGGSNNFVTDKASGNRRVAELEIVDIENKTCRVAGKFSSDSSTIPSVLPNGNVLLVTDHIVGLFDPKAETIHSVDSLIYERYGFSTVSSPDGNVYVFGGYKSHTDKIVEKFNFAAFRSFKPNGQIN